MEYKDKRLIGDTHQKEWIVSFIDGDTETHYVQPVIGEATFDGKHEAMEEMRRIVNAIRNAYPKCYIDDRYDSEDFSSIKIEGTHEYWITVRCVVKHGYIDLSRELKSIEQVKPNRNKTNLVTVSYDEDAVDDYWANGRDEEYYRYDDDDAYEAALEKFNLICLDIEDKLNKIRRRYEFKLPEKYNRY